MLRPVIVIVCTSVELNVLRFPLYFAMSTPPKTIEPVGDRTSLRYRPYESALIRPCCNIVVGIEGYGCFPLPGPIPREGSVVQFDATPVQNCKNINMATLLGSYQ